MSIQSRLSKVVLFYHTGNEWNFAVTGSFKVIPLRFQRKKLARSLPEGWYRLTRRLANTSLVIKSWGDVRYVPFLELADICRRMRIRFGKLLRDVRSTEKKLPSNMLLIPFDKVPFIANCDWFVYVLVPRNGVMNISIIPRQMINEKIRGHEKDDVIVYITKKYIGILHFTDSRTAQEPFM